MNISIINLKEIKKKSFFLIFVIVIFLFIKILCNHIPLLERIITFEKCSKLYNSMFLCMEDAEKNYNLKAIKHNFPILSIVEGNNINDYINIDEKGELTNIETRISESPNVESVSDRNIEESYNFTYESIKINNQSNYDLSNISIDPNLNNFENKKIIIYHTHTCESYTPTEDNNYIMTGNYRTTDNNYNVVRVGEELKKYLSDRGFEVIHDKTYHDFPSYNGSYDRSYETAINILNNNKDVSLVIDIHRDAVGDGSWYGPTISIDGKSVAQMMFVVRNRWRRFRSSQLDRKFK